MSRIRAFWTGLVQWLSRWSLLRPIVHSVWGRWLPIWLFVKPLLEAFGRWDDARSLYLFISPYIPASIRWLLVSILSWRAWGIVAAVIFIVAVIDYCIKELEKDRTDYKKIDERIADAVRRAAEIPSLLVRREYLRAKQERVLALFACADMAWASIQEMAFNEHGNPEDIGWSRTWRLNASTIETSLREVQSISKESFDFAGDLWRWPTPPLFAANSEKISSELKRRNYEQIFNFYITATREFEGIRSKLSSLLSHANQRILEEGRKVTL